MPPNLDWTTILIPGLAVGLGAFVQSSIGFGLAVVAAPFVVLVAPQLMPGALLVTSLMLPVMQLAFGPRNIAWRLLGWACTTRLIATPLGVVIVASFSPSAIAATVGALVLLTVLACVVTIQVRASAPAAAAAGAIAGVSGTAAGIGGPYFALVLQHEPPERVRSTLAAFFVIGAAFALGGLTIGGQFTRQQLLTGLAWLPFIAIGYALAAPARRYLDAGRLRRAVLLFCVVSGVLLLARALG